MTTEPKAQRLKLLDIPFDNYSVAETLDIIETALQEKRFIQHSVINVAKLIKMRRDKALYDAVTSCDIVNVDGMGVIWGAKFLGTRIKERVAGVDLFFDLLALAEKNQHPIYLLGAKTEVLAAAVTKIKHQYPALKIAGSHHGYFWDNEHRVVEDIKRSGASMLFVAITSPKKELFIQQWGDELGVDFVMGVGGTFDIVAGITKRAPKWMQKCGLEWFFRVSEEPRRMWKRYLVTNSLFLWALIIAKIKQWSSV